MDSFYEEPQEPEKSEFEAFKKKITPLIGLDLTQYKSKQMERRILSFMSRHNINTLDDFYLTLKKDSDLLTLFINMITINVSEFFRDEKKFKELEEIYLPEIKQKTYKRIKIWSAGCSIGAEIYSIAMMLDKNGLLYSSYLLATDFDNKVLEKAKEGIFSAAEYETIKPCYESYFTSIGGDKYKILPKLAANINFKKHDLLKDTFEREFHIILCRNVFIYFTEKAKEMLYRKFYNSLANGGILFVGSTERIINYKDIGFITRTPFFYQRVDS